MPRPLANVVGMVSGALLGGLMLAWAWCLRASVGRDDKTTKAIVGDLASWVGAGGTAQLGAFSGGTCTALIESFLAFVDVLWHGPCFALSLGWCSHLRQSVDTLGLHLVAVGH